MRKAEIDALVRAHRGRARPVAFFHVLRQTALEPDDHAFLAEHIEELGASDLLRWRVRCEPGFSGPVIRQLARLAIADPMHFKYEVLDVPRLSLDEQEWIELADLLRGKVPAAVFDPIVARCRRDPPERLNDFMFTPGVIRSPDLFFDAGDDPGDLTPEDPPRPLRERSLRQILAARQAGTLVIEDGPLLALAMDRAKSPAEDWSFAVLDFPDALRDAVFEKARRTRKDSERANLLGWLEARGVPRSVLLDLALEALRAGEISYAVLSWLTRQLTTRAAWDKYGLLTLSTLVAQRAFPEIGELVTVAWSEAGRGGKDAPRGLLEAIQVAFALSLIGLTREALAGGDQARAMAALSALACLDPPSRVSRAVHDLRRAPGAGPEIEELVAVNERLVKHSDARDASLEGVIAALHAIADAFG